jgi:hypothetical protein
VTQPLHTSQHITHKNLGNTRIAYKPRLEVAPSLYGIDLLFDQRDPDGGEFQAGLAYRVLHTSHVGRFFVFSRSITP